MLTALMKFKIILHHTGQKESIITSSDHKFIYFQQIELIVLRKSATFHRLLENFILKSSEIRCYFDRLT
jgi:hypothetical protein